MVEFDFQKYIQSRRSDRVDANGARAYRDYAFGEDVRVLKTLERTRVVGLALRATARLERTWLQGEVLEKAVKVGPGAHPQVRELAHDAAKALGMGTPPVYLSEQLGTWKAAAVVVEGAVSVLVAKGVVEALEEGALMFLLGQQFGHLQNGHAPYLTCSLGLDRLDEGALGWVVSPARMALGSWRKLGDVTADRAGLLACRELEVAQRALSALVEVKVAEGADEAATRRARHGLEVRLRALGAFAGSEYFRLVVGEQGGEALKDVDREVERALRLEQA